MTGRLSSIIEWALKTVRQPSSIQWRILRFGSALSHINGVSGSQRLLPKTDIIEIWHQARRFFRIPPLKRFLILFNSSYLRDRWRLIIIGMSSSAARSCFSLSACSISQLSTLHYKRNGRGREDEHSEAAVYLFAQSSINTVQPSLKGQITFIAKSNDSR